MNHLCGREKERIHSDDTGITGKSIAYWRVFVNNKGKLALTLENKSDFFGIEIEYCPFCGYRLNKEK